MVTEQAINPRDAAHVIQFPCGKFRGQANTRVESPLDATLYTRGEAQDRTQLFEEGTKAVRLDQVVDLAKAFGGGLR